MKDRFGFDWNGIGGTLPWRRPHLSRRLFFRHAASAVGGYLLLPARPAETISRAAAAPIGKAKYCIFVLMNGGPSHVDTFDLKEGGWMPANFAPATFDGVRFPQGLLPATAAQLDSVALVRSARSWAAVHQLAREWMQLGRNPVAASSKFAPHIGSVVSLELSSKNPDKTLPAFLALNTGDLPGPGYLPPQHAPFRAASGGGGLANTTHRDGPAAFERRFALLESLEAEERAVQNVASSSREVAESTAAARAMMYNPRVEQAFRFTNDERNRYGRSAFGDACLVSRNLLRSGLGARFIQVGIGGWDSHSNIYGGALNAGNANSLARQFDNGLGNLLADLKQDGLLDETLIVCMGEFGRTVGNLNSSGGRDHFLQQAVLFAGAGIRGPKAIGSTDELGRITTEPGWSRSRDVRPEDVEATIYSALGIDWTTVRRDDPTGRGFEYVPLASTEDRYGPLHELWN